MSTKVTNNAYATLASGISSGALTIVLASGQGARFPTLTGSDYFWGTLVDGSNNIEVVKVTARTSDTLTVLRGQDDTTAKAYLTGDRFELRPTAALFNDKLDAATATTTYQPLDADLTAIAALTSAANKLPYATGSGAWALTDFNAAGRAIVNSAGTANTFPYFSAANTVTLAAITAAGLAILAAADAAAQRTALGISSSAGIPVRQTVLSGPVDSSGYPNFGGSTGSTTVTASGTLVSTAANGFDSSGAVNRIGSSTNPSWTGLSTNGTMYLYLDIASDGTCTTGSTTLAPNYQNGGTYSTTNGQFTFNIQEMVGKVGNGSIATQTYRVFVGEVTVAGGVVTVITWYAIVGRYRGKDVNPISTTRISMNHNIGVTPRIWKVAMQCQSADVGYAPLDEVDVYGFWTATPLGPAVSVDAKTIGVIANSGGYSVLNKSSAAFVSVTTANWDTVFYADRGW
jgi:hypothetical protein